MGIAAGAPLLFHEGKVALHCGDCLAVLDSLSENSVDSIVCDPPYHLKSIVKRFGAANATPVRVPDEGASNDLKAAYARHARGFMGKQWDGGDIAFRVATWEKCLRVLKPGGYIIAFSSTRTYHRMACAIEDAGFITHPMIGWIFSQGFPKAHRVHAEGLEGWRYGAQSLKPALEPIYMGQKPFSEDTGTANVRRWSTGAINVDACRISTEDELTGSGKPPLRFGGQNSRPFHEHAIGLGVNQSPGGRWPANVCHDGSQEVLAAFPDAPGQQYATGPQDAPKGGTPVYGDFGARDQHSPIGDSGSAARFFASFPQQNDVHCGLCCSLLRAENGSFNSCNANNAKSSSPTGNILGGASVHCDAAELQQPESVGSAHPSNGLAGNAESFSSRCPAQPLDSVQSNAQIWPLSKIVQNVRSAETLCGSCATAIAQSLAATRLGQDPESLPLPDSISERSAQILRRTLALYVQGREDTDTILTIPNLKQLFGSVFHAIGLSTESEELSKDAPTKSANCFRYASKAASDDRLKSKHPTVKPLDLMQWLARLITPRSGVILDPFAGTGTTAHAALLENFRCISIEREPEYQDDFKRRMDLVFEGKDQRNAKLSENLPASGLPLFGGEQSR